MNTSLTHTRAFLSGYTILMNCIQFKSSDLCEYSSRTRVRGGLNQTRPGCGADSVRYYSGSCSESFVAGNPECQTNNKREFFSEFSSPPVSASRRTRCTRTKIILFITICIVIIVLLLYGCLTDATNRE